MKIPISIQYPNSMIKDPLFIKHLKDTNLLNLVKERALEQLELKEDDCKAIHLEETIECDYNQIHGYIETDNENAIKIYEQSILRP